MTLSIQFMTMAAMVLSGFYLGLIQDTYRRFTRYWQRRIFLTYVMEICFWLTQSIILFYVLYRVNAGEIRFYIVIACLLGFSMYQVVAANLYKRLLEHVIRIFMSIYHFFARVVQVLIITPIRWIIITLLTILLMVLKLFGNIIFFILKILVAPFKWVGYALYQLLPEKVKKNLHKIAGFYSRMKNICIKWAKFLKINRR
ncbi:spore cortex biosynthesis protein YabQ [Oceanobacillus chungangensis]|uniref:Spore cortex biosynthesis protein YabQ n=1 Tax=Oceanobacillus chungangensis TaxID=1229152 RepID=A0A3D8PMG6_9BACI|nr:spore cortex biosynthesis protein YabQ [Oceanobacillus chungangensis]RDW16862.1 spore cortex biosynthesis protein YabQ [Oceanobacillus chungangensis]